MRWVAHTKQVVGYLHAVIKVYISKIYPDLLEKPSKANKKEYNNVWILLHIFMQLQKAIVSESDADILLNGNTEIEHVSRLLNLDRNK